MSLLSKKMETRHLHNADMKRIVRILRRVPPHPSQCDVASYEQQIKKMIHDLPYRLRSSRLSLSSTNLCLVHKGLSSHLLNDIWAWLRYELDGTIGRFLYPVILSGGLQENEELRIRQLEPVLRMYHRDYELAASAPPGRPPIDRGAHWAYETKQCPGCMMARIGSDEDVLFALFAGMVGRMKEKASNVGISRGLSGLDAIKSKRLRFVRYWIKAFRGGEHVVLEAAQLGLKMKVLRMDWKEEQYRLLEKRRLMREQSRGTTPHELNYSRDPCQCRSRHENQIMCCWTHDGRLARDCQNSLSEVCIDITEPYQPKEWRATAYHDPKLGPRPRTQNVDPLTPAEPMGFNMMSLQDEISSLQTEIQVRDVPHTRSSTSTVYPGSSVSVAHLHARPYPPYPKKLTEIQKHITPLKRNVSTHSRNDSAIGDLSTLEGPSFLPSLTLPSTIASYDGGGPLSARELPQHFSVYDPLNSSIYDIPTVQRKEDPVDRKDAPSHEQLVEKYRQLLASYPKFDQDEDDEVAPTLPKPKRNSIYGAFGTGKIFSDAFQTVDEEVVEQEDDVLYEDDMSLPQSPAAGCSTHVSAARMVY